MKIDYSKLSDDELWALYDNATIELQKRKKNKNNRDIKTLNIGGFTAKDIKVVHGDLWDNCDGSINYSFYLVKDGIAYDFYYSNGKDKKGKYVDAGDWWPFNWEDEDCRFDRFIPEGFCEAAENYYEFDGSLEDAIKILNDSGITNIEEYKP